MKLKVVQHLSTSHATIKKNYQRCNYEVEGGATPFNFPCYNKKKLPEM